MVELTRHLGGSCSWARGTSQGRPTRWSHAVPRGDRCRTGRNRLALGPVPIFRGFLAARPLSAKPPRGGPKRGPRRCSGESPPGSNAQNRLPRPIPGNSGPGGARTSNVGSWHSCFPCTGHTPRCPPPPPTGQTGGTRNKRGLKTRCHHSAARSRDSRAPPLQE